MPRKYNNGTRYICEAVNSSALVCMQLYNCYIASAWIREGRENKQASLCEIEQERYSGVNTF